MVPVCRNTAGEQVDWGGAMENRISNGPAIRIDRVELKASSPEDQHAGLLGWVSFTLCGALRVEGVALRRTSDGRRKLSFPERKDRSGQRHDLLRPLDQHARRAIETAVFEALGMAVSAAG